MRCVLTTLLSLQVVRWVAAKARYEVQLQEEVPFPLCSLLTRLHQSGSAVPLQKGSLAVKLDNLHLAQGTHVIIQGPHPACCLGTANLQCHPDAILT